MINEQGLRAATDQATSEVFITLLAISWPNVATPEYFALNDEDIEQTIGTETITYKRSGFSYLPPAEGEDGNLIGSLQLDIVDRVLVQTVKDLDEKPVIVISEVLASDPNTVQIELPPFQLFAINWDDTVMQGSIGTADDSGEPATSFNYTPEHAPALYAG